MHATPDISRTAAPTRGQYSLYVDDLERWRRVVSADKAIDGDLSVRTIEGATILPLRATTSGRHRWQGGVVDKDGALVAGHHATLSRHDAHLNIVEAYPVPADVAYRPEVVIWGGGRDARHFGHFLTENLSRLWYWVENPDLRVKVAFVNNGLSLDHPGVELYRRLGLRREDILFIEEPTRFDAVIVPDQALHLSGEMHFAHSRSTYDALRASVEPATVEKVYLTRTKLAKKAWFRDVNEEMLEDFYAARGYEIVAPENLSLGAQIALMAGAREVACTAGTLSHQVLFCQDDVRFDIILRDRREALPVQWSMNALRNATSSIVDCSLELLPSSHTAGLHYFTTTPHWSRYAEEQHGVSVPGAPPDSHVLDYLRQWAEVVVATPPRDLSRFPAWTVADLAASIGAYVAGKPLHPRTRAKLVDHFGTGTGSTG